MHKEINVGLSRTINLGNYESTKITASIVQEISSKDKRNNEKIFDELFVECENFVLKKCKAEVKK